MWLFKERNQAMLNSESIDLLAVALAKFHADCPKIVKDTRNDYFKSRYADLGTILGIVNPILATHGLSVVQLVEGENQLMTILLHASGQWIGQRSTMRPTEAVIRHDKEKNPIMGVTPQALGSAITYQRRYAVAAILSLCIDDDDDGNAASNTGRKPEDRPRAEQGQNAKPESKPEAKPVEKLSDERINEIMTKIMQGAEAELPKMESALSNLGIQGAIDKEVWSDLAAAMLYRWYGVSPTPAALGVVANKVVGYRSKGLVSDEQFATLTARLAERTEELKGK